MLKSERPFCSGIFHELRGPCQHRGHARIWSEEYEDDFRCLCGTVDEVTGGSHFTPSEQERIVCEREQEVCIAAVTLKP
jgi:hypothetical protein